MTPLHLRFSCRNFGFSFVELMASLAIVALLASVAIPVAHTTVRRNKEIELRRALRDIRQAIDAYKQASAQGLIATLPEQSGYPPSLSNLVDGVDNALAPGGAKLYFLRRLPRDPFFPDPTASPIETWGTRSFDSPPIAPKSGDDVFDIYSLSEQRGLNNTAYRDW